MSKSMFDRFTTSRGAYECPRCHREVLEGTTCQGPHPAPVRKREPRPRCGKCGRRHDMTLACLTAFGRPLR